METQGHRIAGVTPGSVAEACGLTVGDRLLTINGEPLIDQIDYQFWAATSHLVLEFSEKTLTVDKDEDEPLGLSFGDSLALQTMRCQNHCRFCFVDQLPKGLRAPLYVKDDDWRESLLMGNFVTLTNLSEREFERLIRRHASPLYVSVHATDGAVRARLMGNPKAAGIMDQLQRLGKHGIRVHAQIVLCPCENDGAVLEKTLDDLISLWPDVETVAVVPVGLTRYRDRLAALSPVTQADAEAALAIIEAAQRMCNRALGTPFVLAADELYLLADRLPPPDPDAVTAPQRGNGVGLVSTLLDEYRATLPWLTPVNPPRRVAVVTGMAAAPFLTAMLAQYPIPCVQVSVIPVENRFFGDSVTVAGLLTGRDIAAAIQGLSVDEILLPRVCLNHEGTLFLDELSLPTLQAFSPAPITVVPIDGATFAQALAGQTLEDF